MKILKYKIYTLLAILIGLVGCDEDSFLEELTPNAYDAALFWQTENDFNSGLTTVYGALQFSSISGRQIVSEMAQGDLTFTTTFAPFTPQFLNLNFNDTDLSVTNKWNELYIGINRANQVIENIATVDETLFNTYDKNEIEGQARFLRAFFYFQLVNTYGQGILHTKTITSDADALKEMSTLEEITNAVIIPDLKYAQENIRASWTGTDVGRITSGAASSLLGKVYLYDKEWSLAATEFAKVVDSGVYSLVADPMDNFTHFNEFNEESILETNYSFDLNAGIGGNTVDDNQFGSGAEATALSGPIGKQGNGGFNQIFASYYLHELMVNDEKADGTDGHSNRLSASIAPSNFEDEYYQSTLLDLPGPSYNAYGISAYVKKHSNWYHLNVEPELSRSGINFRHIRYADVLLMYAEALLEGGTNNGNVDQAIELIDLVRTRAGVKTLATYRTENGNQIPELQTSLDANDLTEFPLVNVDANAILTHLQFVERPLELCYEGHRWKDLVRWGIVADALANANDQESKLVVKYPLANNVPPFFFRTMPLRHYQDAVSNYNANKDYWPIPNKELQNNSAL
ncbi:hypothetical protein FHR24_002351 [Wenyingzhuangia heitensis]|uniref:Starch-binding associating with outer membrane n=1 Tax=Wenyingzhuangia heitensis TaxID=1487859 RepID=A0ABX0UDG7_9FLAO|nr:RagB/SusD family nutrient uptake outer membrane protein [Wenyingzhuangia heitensis]NIJ45880.1 hypothetical protein [Wenyingzhuangia heitensis]